MDMKLEQKNMKFWEACKSQNLVKIQKFLIDPDFDPTYLDNVVFVNASAGGLYKTVKLLLTDKRFDPSARDNAAIQLAIDRSRLNLPGSSFEVVKLLVRDPRVDTTKARLYTSRWEKPEFRELIDARKMWL